MARTTNPVALNQWYGVASLTDLGQAQATGLLGQHTITGPGLHATADSVTLPVQPRYGCLWTTLGNPERDNFDIIEDREPDCRFLSSG